MILVADSGSTKTDWCLVANEEKQNFYETPGLNPYFYDENAIAERLANELPEELQQQHPEAIYLYGAGSSTEELKDRVHYGLSTIFPDANIQVHHDLLGSARALCGDEPGIATILGTGSNACEFDGSDIVHQSGGIGFILGDEGSGTDLGRRWLQHYFYGELPSDLQEAFEQEWQPDKAEIIDKIYRQPMPNRYLATFAEFLGNHLRHPFVHDLVEVATCSFLKRHVLKFEHAYRYPVHSVGSIATHFRSVWETALNNYNLKQGRVIDRPIDNLVAYHLYGGKLKDS